jgi:Fe-S oxidoreductase
LRHLPQIFAREHNFRALPAIAKIPFRDRWARIAPRVSNPRCRVALFSGCVQDFVYPGQLEAAVKLLAAEQVDVAFPMDQSCCGLPVEMMGEKEAAEDVARQNVAAMDADRFDHIVTLCASCASHLKKAYPRILGKDPRWRERTAEFAAKVIPFSAFMNDVLDIPAKAFQGSEAKVTYHAPCHLCRGLGITEAPRELIRKSGETFVPADEELTCCGFGGTYSSKFPEISAQILNKKLEDVRRTGADILVTECPGCVMQLRGGMERRRDPVEVLHLAELLQRNKKTTPG